MRLKKAGQDGNLLQALQQVEQTPDGFIPPARLRLTTWLRLTG
ncbi:MAG: hypothetical protein ABL876_05020 [Chitinophagaceae bacterium]